MTVLRHLIAWALGLAPAEAWTTDAERACLIRHAAGKKRLVEVGVWQGGTTRHLRRAMSPDGTLYAVDPFPKGRLGFSVPRLIAGREVGHVRNGRLVWLRLTGEAATRTGLMRTPNACARDIVLRDPRFTVIDEVDTLTVLRRLPG